MANGLPFMGLSGLGMVDPSQASSVDDALGLQELLKSNAILDDTARANVLQEALKELDQKKNPGVLDRLLSPAGLAALLGVGAAGALGGAPAAAGFGLGALQSAGVAKEADAALTRKSRDELAGMLEDTQERLSKGHQRVAALLQSNPELFVDPKTGEQTVSPELLGFYATGVAMPISATTRRVMDRRDTQWQNRYKLLTDRLAEAPTLDDRRNITQGLLSLLEFPNDPALAESLAAAPPDKFPTELANTYLRYGGETGLQAILHAQENGLPLEHPDVVRMIQYRDPDTSGGKTTPADRFLSLAQEINAWSADPANLDRMREIRQENIQKGEGAVSIAIAREVLGGRRGDFDIYLDEAELRTPDQLAAIQQEFKRLTDQYGLGVGLAGIDKLDFVRNMTDEERAEWMWKNATQSVEAQQQISRDAQAKADLSLANGVATRIQKELGTAQSEANALSTEILRIALTRATRPDGSIDRVRFEQEVRKVADEAIAGAKGE